MLNFFYKTYTLRITIWHIDINYICLKSFEKTFFQQLVLESVFCSQKAMHVPCNIISCGHSGLWPFWFVAVSVCGLLFVVFSVCGRFGLQSFRFFGHLAVSACGHFGLWPFRLWPFRFVAVMTRYLLYYPSICRLLFIRLAITIRQGFTFNISGPPTGWRIKSDTLWISF